MARRKSSQPLLERIIDRVESRPRRRRPRRNRKLKVGSTPRRIQAALLVCAILASVAAGRAITIQVFDPSAYAEAAAREMTASRVLAANRGEITDRNGTPLAVSVPAVTVVADPLLIATNGKLDTADMTEEDKQQAAAAPALIAAVLAKHLGESADTYLSQLTKQNTRYSILAKKVMASTYLDIASDLSAQDLIGVYREQTPDRTYPNGTLAANIIGFVNSEGSGAAGLEYSLDSSLTGTDGLEVYETSPNGRIPLGSNVVTAAEDGTSYQLTIDSELQWTLEARLAAQVKTSGATSGTGIVMNVKTGEILAMANTNTYDPNNPGDADASATGNDAIMSTYEPGSVQKLATVAALLDTGTITPETRVVVPNTIQSADKRIKDAWTHGTMYLTARGVVAYSSNVGTVKLARQMDKATLAEYLSKLGFGSTTGLPLAGEATGSIPGADMSDQTRDQVAFGQGLSVTAVQEAAAVAALVNGGVYHQPTIITSATDGDGNAVPVAQQTAKRVVSETTSSQIRDMMEAMAKMSARQGNRSVALDDFRSGAKTGTAQRYDSSCGCYRGYVVSVIGAAPIEDPQILTYIVIDQPGKGYQSGNLAAGPVYKDIMQLALVRYGVAQSTTTSPDTAVTYNP
ncbi:peptidoglycan D,D-transpeptidase FtsI family protein [Propionicicella superfundia]|uniref:peptidoglycan D,D-transpeptidase FtsI family protein n=1 Tax=Propionicicella superfundia TaxID=348582 RepID=UPI000415A509|nr:penicillin-binding protein 2 [Propionicicella superfundia]